MKILSIEKYRDLDRHTVQNKTPADVLIGRVVKSFVNEFVAIFPLEKNQNKEVKVFCGLGNNGTDGLEIAYELNKLGYNSIIYIVRHSNEVSEIFTNHFVKVSEKVGVFNIIESDDLPEIKESDIVIDGIFGTGLNKKIEVVVAETILHINEYGQKIISIDLPSGLHADELSEEPVIEADYTFTIELPKKALFLEENYKYVGEWKILKIGLDQEYLDLTLTEDFYVDKNLAKNLLKSKYKFGHKGSFGRAMLIGGSSQYPGAILLSIKSCLKSGVGYTYCHTPRSVQFYIPNQSPEVIVDADINEDFVTSFEKYEVSKFDGIGIGPGMVENGLTSRFLENFLKKCTRPLVLDADALNIIANQKFLSLVPEDSILTPHLGEFNKLLENYAYLTSLEKFNKDEDGLIYKNDFEKLEVLKNLAKEKKLNILLKDRHSILATSKGELYFNSTGNPGIAKAGSGDVLTGFVTGLLAQNYNPEEAGILGMLLHGLSGDFAKNEKTEYAMTPTDIIKNLDKAFYEIKKDD